MVRASVMDMQMFPQARCEIVLGASDSRRQTNERTPTGSEQRGRRVFT